MQHPESKQCVWKCSGYKGVLNVSTCELEKVFE